MTENMGKTSDLTPRKLSAVKTLLKEQRYSQRLIASKLGVSPASVNRIKRKLDLGQDLGPQRIARCGAKPLFNARAKRVLMRECLANRRGTSQELSTRMAAHGVHSSSSTIRRVLVKAGLRARRPLKKAKLTPAMSKKRLVWARQYADWTQADWSKVECCNTVHLYNAFDVIIRRECCSILLSAHFI
jgi:transposase